MESSADSPLTGRQPPDPSGAPHLLDTTEIRHADLPAFSGDPEPGPAPEPVAVAASVDADVPTDDGGARLIRPYAMTGGRTTASADINLESQIQTSTRLNGDASSYRWEAAKILQLAERPMALVELAARAEIPIGLARVGISDLLEEGVVNVQRNVTVTSYTSLLEKVLDGIRDL
ncbi:MAG: DUF742 domain-containing protein [Ilumatobacteraceae bacterium]